ncbi:MAG: ATP-dependent zinc metalloprotease FtsH [Firmicutes bacterium]|nr:ATP-dependent zinc metalloprotease FtsH [Bacillota bacterium]
MKKHWRTIVTYIAIFVIITAIISVTGKGIKDQSIASEYTYYELIQKLDEKEVTRIEIKAENDAFNYGYAKAVLADGTIIEANVPSLTSFMERVDRAIVEDGVKVSTPDIGNAGFITTLIPTIIIMIISILMFSFLFQRMGGGGGGGGGKSMMSFGKSRARVNLDEKNRVTFADVAGCDEEKNELVEIVEFLKDSSKFMKLGARIPKGVLLVGPPGTGKTLLAKAIAGEAGVPFFSISGSDFVEMFVGVGASRVRDLFDQAKKNCPCIVFIDEIDAVGRRRGAGLGGGHDEREQTLNQLLVEMDGFGVNQGVIVIAATNRADILDPAILRPGRFDRQVYVGRPDVKGREAILRVHSKGKPLHPDVELKIVAKITAGFTGADLENLLNEAALLAARENKRTIDMEELQKAFVKVGVGTEKKSRVISQKEKLITAYHEAGHAILFELLPELDPVHSISIIPTGFAGGYTMPLPGEDKSYVTKRRMEQDITGLLGGRAAEFIVLKDISTGASNDIERATATARAMVTRYGMSDVLGPIQFGKDSDDVFLGYDMGHSRQYSEEIATLIDKEVRRIIDTAYEQAITLLKENIDVLHNAAKLLIENEKLTGDEFRALFRKPPELPEAETTPV